jgi:hypothetical protein
MRSRRDGNTGVNIMYSVHSLVDYKMVPNEGTISVWS